MKKGLVNAMGERENKKFPLLLLFGMCKKLFV